MTGEINKSSDYEEFFIVSGSFRFPHSIGNRKPLKTFKPSWVDSGHH